MSYVEFRGISTDALAGVAISQMPNHRRAGMRYSEYYVKGRDGALHVEEGYSNFDLPVTLILLDAPAEARQAVNAWATGTGKLVTSDDPTKAYKASVLKEVRWTRQRGNKGYFDTAQVTFHCDPYMYEAQETVAVFTADGSLLNPGTDEALPTIVVEGAGNVTFTVGGKTVTISGMTSGVPVTLDCEAGYVFSASGSMTMTGDFPTIPKGVSAVDLGANCTKLTITPHWRWI